MKKIAPEFISFFCLNLLLYSLLKLISRGLNIKKLACTVVIVVISFNSLADESVAIRHALGMAFLFIGLILLIVTVAMSLLLHFIFNSITKNRRHSFWKILIGAVIMCSLYVYIEMNSSFFSLMIGHITWEFEYILPLIIFIVMGGGVGFIISKKKTV